MILQVGVKVIIKSSKGKILLIQRSGYGDLDSSWDIPGGRIEPNEPLIEALRREVFEEIGNTFSSKPILLAAQDIFPKDKGIHVVRLTYEIKEDIMVGKLSDEHSDAQYFSTEDALELTLDPLIKELIQLDE